MNLIADLTKCKPIRIHNVLLSLAWNTFVHISHNYECIQIDLEKAIPVSFPNQT